MDASSVSYNPLVPARSNNGVAPAAKPANSSSELQRPVEYIAKTDPEQLPPRRERGRNAVEDTFLQVEQSDQPATLGQLVNVRA
ncbi:hypothetical protein CHH28_00415 [Bacterioplanes sanyensis]|uniref:Uncharacterized protein n=1 Tax=Bacterioplanes sanyensis TaxID=1249553 RepID=A0A222FER7_9GAMM|nr:hypothetical protein [Bacterioplanes sanyensis]ASP37239.1 hypothetical protein CHH28_00415 [Bacterioplanes sanyensis]